MQTLCFNPRNHLDQGDLVAGQAEQAVDALVDFRLQRLHPAAWRERRDDPPRYFGAGAVPGMRGGAVRHIRATSSGVRP